MVEREGECVELRCVTSGNASVAESAILVGPGRWVIYRPANGCVRRCRAWFSTRDGGSEWNRDSTVLV